MDHVYEFLLKEYSADENDDNDRLTPFVKAMPDKYKNDDAVKAYRDYYLGDKWEFATWKARREPDWWPFNHVQIKKQEVADEFNRKFNASVKI